MPPLPLQRIGNFSWLPWEPAPFFFNLPLTNKIHSPFPLLPCFLRFPPTPVVCAFLLGTRCSNKVSPPTKFPLITTRAGPPAPTRLTNPLGVSPASRFGRTFFVFFNHRAFLTDFVLPPLAVCHCLILTAFQPGIFFLVFLTAP